MGITGSIVVYVIIWWIVFFSVLPIGIKHSEKPFKSNLEGTDPGAPKNPKIVKKIAPARVSLVITQSRNLAVCSPGLTPGTYPPFFFKSSAICTGLNIIETQK